jgi:hypothetical protein
MPETLQGVIVTIVAAGAAWVVIRQVFSVVKPAGEPKCSSCTSSNSVEPPLDDRPKPLTFIRSR